jgi:hypothetical protein
MKGPVFLAVAILLLPTIAHAQIIDHSNPALGNDDVVSNQSYAWGPIFLGGICRLTDKGTSETSSIFSRERVNITRFETSFVFQILSGGPDDASEGEGNCADGLTFTIQNQGADALGAAGGSLGYEGIARSLCIKFDTVPNDSDPSVSSTGLFVNGQAPYGGHDLMQDGIKLRSQHPFRVDMAYDGRVLRIRIADTTTGASSLQSYPVDIPRIVGGNTAHVGFTAATGLGSSAQDVLKWYFASPPLRRFGRQSGSGATRVASSAGRDAAGPTSKPKTVAAWPVGSVPKLKAPMTRTARANER